MELQFFQNVISDLHIVKTEFANGDYDYMLFADNQDYIVKMTHPYYHFQGINGQPTDINDFDSEEFWENILLKPDTLIYSFAGDIIDGQTFYSSENISTVNGDYFIEKEYYVENAPAILEYPVYDPSLYNAMCGSLINEENCNLEENCEWIEPSQFDSNAFTGCDNLKSNIIDSCLVINRIITTTTLGPGQGFRLRTKTYLKPHYNIVKETLEISWDNYPWLPQDSNWHFVSGIEFMNSISNIESNASPDNFFVNYQTLNIEDFNSNYDFNYSPFRLKNTMGLLRFEYPIE